MPEEARRKRDFRITHEMVRDEGPTPGCQGCRAARTGGQGNHSAACRTRFEEVLGRTESGRRRLRERDVRHGLAQPESREVINLDGEAEEPERGEAEDSVEGQDRGIRRREPSTPRRSENEAEPGPPRRRPRIEEERGQRRAREDDEEGGDERPQRFQRVNAIDKAVADVVRISSDFARERGLNPDDKCNRDIAREIIKSLDEKHARKMKNFEASSRNDSGRERGSTRGIAEAYSPPRMTQVAHEFGLRPQWALDLTEVDRDDGEAWDFNVEAKRTKAVEKLHESRPEMVMLGPTCAPFSSLNIGWNYSRMTTRDAQSMIEDGMRHLSFAAHLCMHQARQSRYFALEHPASAASWNTEVIEMLRGLPGVREVEFDFCSLGMVSTDDQGTAPVKKRTRIITNCPALIEALQDCQCSRDHRHVQLVHGRASACQCYPPEFCRLVCRAVAYQLDKDLKIKRAGARKKAVINSLCNTRSSTHSLRYNIAALTCAAKSPDARWAICAFRKAIGRVLGGQAGSSDCVDVPIDPAVESVDCTPPYDGPG